MATGPMTLLVDPVAGTYEDAAGVHDLPWHGPKLIGGRLGAVSDQYPLASQDAAATRDKSAVCVTAGFSGPFVNHMPHGRVSTSGSLAHATAANATLSAAITLAILSDWGDWDAQPLFVDAYGRGGFVAFGSGNAGRIGILTATDPNAQVTFLSDASASGTYLVFAMVANDAAAPRQMQMVVNGALVGSPVTVPARTFAAINAYASITGAQSVGFRVIDAQAGEKVYFGDIAAIPSDSLTPMLVPMLPGNATSAPNEVYDPANVVNPITIWDGTAYSSTANQGESFWYVPVTAAHLPEERMMTVSRFAYLHWPLPDTWLVGTVQFVRYTNTYDAIFAVNGAITGGAATWETYGYGSGGVSIGGASVTADLSAPSPEFQTLGVGWNDDEIILRLGDEQGSATRANWEGTEFPFLGIAEEMLFQPGASLDFWAPSVAAYRHQAIFGRLLTDAEWTYLQDPASVWHFNLFAEPVSASISGLDEPLYRGDDREVTITVLDADGDPVPLYGHTVWFTGKHPSLLRESTDDRALLALYVTIGNDGAITASNGVESIDAANGAITFSFEVPSDTPQVHYDVQVEDINGDISTLAKSVFPVRPDVTRRETTP